MHTLKSILLTFLLMNTYQPGVFAQASGNIGNAETAEITNVQIRTLGLKKFKDKTVFYRLRKEFKELPLGYFRTSERITATLGEDGKLHIYRKSENPDPSGIEYEVQNKLVVPTDARQLLVLATTDGEKVYMNAVADNLSSDEREWLCINTSRVPLAVQLGNDTKPVGIPPGKSIAHRVELESGKGAAVRVAAYKEEKWERIYSRFWPIYEGQRSMVVFMEEGTKIKVYNIFDAVAR